jgi:Fe2+ transport system protein B
VSKFSIGHGTLEWAKKSLNLYPCQHYNFEGMKRAYNQRMLATHPDKNMNALEADRERFGEEFRDARVAWNIIKRGNAINKIKRTIITTPRDTTTTPCDTQYANDLKKNLESFKELGSFLKELTRIHGVSYRLAEQTKNLEAHLAEQTKNLETHSAEQRKKLQAHLAEVEPDRTTRAPFIMQSRFEKESGVLLFRGEEER